MRIGVDVREAKGQVVGKGRVARELAERVPMLLKSNHFDFYTKAAFPLKTAANVEWKSVSGKSVLWHRNVAKQANREDDAYLTTTSYVTPRWLKIPFGVVVYDLITFKDFAVPQQRAKAIERATLAPALKKASTILAISQATADDLVSLFPESKGKITVMPLAADDHFKPYAKKETDATKKKFKLRKPYIFFAGTLEPRKNLVQLIRAYSELPQKIQDTYDLVLVGKKGWDYESIFNTIDQLDLNDCVHHLDYVSDQDLARLHAGAELFVFPSLYEGFGLPVLEAMQSGTPVITSDISSLPEVGGNAVEYVDPTSDIMLAKTIEKVLGSPALRKKLRTAGLKRAKAYSWKRTAEIAAKALREL